VRYTKEAPGQINPNRLIAKGCDAWQTTEAGQDRRRVYTGPRSAVILDGFSGYAAEERGVDVSRNPSQAHKSAVCRPPRLSRAEGIGNLLKTESVSFQPLLRSKSVIKCWINTYELESDTSVCSATCSVRCDGGGARDASK